MNTITIYIHNIVGGDNGAMQYGVASEIRNYVRDFRGKLPYNNQSSPLLALSLVNTGTTRGVLYIIIKPANGGRTQDYLSCYVFVPAEIEISGKEVVELLHDVESIISNNDLNDKAINAIISKQYQTKKALPQFKASSPEASYAVRYFGKGTDYSLQDIVESPFQNYYASYGYILLSNKEEGTSYPSAKDNFTSKQIVSFVEITPVKDTRGFVLFIDGIRFDHTISLQEGTTHKLSWSKEGYAELGTTIQVKRGMEIPSLHDNDIIMRIPLTIFHVVDRNNNKEIMPYSYRVDFMQKSSMSGKFIDIKEVDFSSARIKFSADGYKSRTLPLKDATNLQVITLEECRFVYNIELNVNSVSYRAQIIENHELDWYDLHLPEGFKHYNRHLAYGEDQINRAEWRGNTNYPNDYDNRWRSNGEASHRGNGRGDGRKKNPFIKPFLIIIASLVVILLTTGLVWPGWMRSSKTPSTDGDDGNVAYFDSTYVKQVTNYLDNNEVWNKDSLAQYDLSSLFDCMNNYKFEDIENLENDSLNNSKAFTSLLEAINESKQIGITVPEDKKAYTDDNTITVSKYIKYIKNKANFQVSNTSTVNSDSVSWDEDTYVDDKPTETDNHTKKNNTTKDSHKKSTTSSGKKNSNPTEEQGISGAGR